MAAPGLCIWHTLEKLVTSNKAWHIRMTSSDGNIFQVTGFLCGEFDSHRWIPLTEASDAERYVFFDLRLKKTVE